MKRPGMPDDWWIAEFERVRPEMLRFLERSFPAHRDMAEDIVQGCFEELFRGRRRIEPVNFPGLVRTICFRRMLDHHRSELRRSVRVVSRNPDQLPAPEDQSGNAERVDALIGILASEIDALPVQDRELLLRGSYGHNLGYPLDVAERKRLSRIRVRLRTNIQARPDYPERPS